MTAKSHQLSQEPISIKRASQQQSIIQQAATSMLMQANSRPQLALSMLG